MKKIVSGVLMLMAASAVFGQWTGTTTTQYTGGLVGIGFTTTANIDTRFHVRTNETNIMKLQYKTGLSSDNYLLVGFNSMPTSNLTLGAGTVFFKSSNASGDMVFLPGTGDNNSGSGYMLIRRDGKVCLGAGQTENFNSNSPVARLNIKCTNTTGNVTTGIQSEVNSSNDWDSYNLNLIVNRTAIKSIGVQNSSMNKEVFAVYGDGTTRIGATVPTGSFANAKLSVDGKIVAQEIYVQNSNWADYVFDSNYQLMSLDTLECYIESNKHLPNVPTTEEVLANGNNTGETDRILLEKIEELTLYIIQLKKEIEALKTGTGN